MTVTSTATVQPVQLQFLSFSQSLSLSPKIIMPDYVDFGLKDLEKDCHVLGMLIMSVGG